MGIAVTVETRMMLIGMLVGFVAGVMGALVAFAWATPRSRPLGTYSPRTRLDPRVPPIQPDKPHKEDS